MLNGSPHPSSSPAPAAQTSAGLTPELNAAIDRIVDTFLRIRGVSLVVSRGDVSAILRDLCQAAFLAGCMQGGKEVHAIYTRKVQP